MRTYITGPTDDRSAVWATNAWLQYPARPSTRSDLPPACDTAESTAAVPVPWQSGAVNRQSPEGSGPAWSSKPEQITASPHSAAGGGVVGEAWLAVWSAVRWGTSSEWRSVCRRRRRRCR